MSFRFSDFINRHTWRMCMQESVCVCVCARVCILCECNRSCRVCTVRACGFSLCVRFGLKPNPTESVCLFAFPPSWFDLVLIPVWGLILVCCFRVRLQLDSGAWQEGRKPLALLLECHWRTPLGAMCHIILQNTCSVLEKAANNAGQIRANRQDGGIMRTLNVRQADLCFAVGRREKFEGEL